MALSLTCLCGRAINVRDELAGSTTRCMYCGRVVEVPAGSAEPRPAAAVADPVPASTPKAATCPACGTEVRPGSRCRQCHPVADERRRPVRTGATREAIAVVVFNVLVVAVCAIALLAHLALRSSDGRNTCALTVNSGVALMLLATIPGLLRGRESAWRVCVGVYLLLVGLLGLSFLGYLLWMAGDTQATDEDRERMGIALVVSLVLYIVPLGLLFKARDNFG